MNWLRGLSLLMVGAFLMVSAPIKANAACSLTATPNGSSVTLSASDCSNGNYYMRIIKKNETSFTWASSVVSVSQGKATQVATSLEKGDYTAKLFLGVADEKASSPFSITENIQPLKCGDPCNPNDTKCPASCPSVYENGQWTCKAPVQRQTKPGDLFCENSAGTNNPKVNTALGCVPVKMDEFITWVLPYVFGIAGGIAFLLMVYGFILMATSQGDPKVVQGARETITSAITGLLISIFALFLLRLIAVDILHIPGIN